MKPLNNLITRVVLTGYNPQMMWIDELHIIKDALAPATNTPHGPQKTTRKGKKKKW